MVPLFRKLIILSNVAYLLWFFLPYYDAKLFTYEVQGLLDANTFDALDIYIRFSLEFGFIFLALYLVSALGLYFFIKQARSLFFILTLITLIIPLVTGVSVQSPIDVVLNQITLMADSVILYMSYFSSVASKFTVHNKTR